MPTPEAPRDQSAFEKNYSVELVSGVLKGKTQREVAELYRESFSDVHPDLLNMTLAYSFEQWIIVRDKKTKALVGATSIDRVQLSNLHDDRCTFYGLAVRSEMRGKGIARFIFKHVLTYAKRKKMEVYLEMRPKDKVAMYMRWGFVPVGESDVFNGGKRLYKYSPIKK